MPAQFRAGIRAFAVFQHGRETCLRQVARAAKNGGYAMVSTFGPEGPTQVQWAWGCPL